MSETKATGLRQTGIEIFVASFVVLFQELALIRWLPVEVRVTAYFPNLILLGAFLGLGIGALRGRKASLLWLWPVSLVVLVAATWAMHGVAFTANGVTEHLWLLYHDLGQDAPVFDNIQVPLVVEFLLGTATFVPLGQYVGRRLELFRSGSSALWGYACDLGGSLLGVVAFAVISWSGLKPVVWFLVPMALGAVLVRAASVRVRVLYAAGAVAVLTMAHLSTGIERFTPYYALSWVRADSVPGVEVRANGSLHQMALDLKEKTGTERRLVTAEGYRYPYLEMGRPIRSALVLGAGTGNDVAVLLDLGAEHIDAVEIDPGILELGKEIHPDHPYDDPRVTIHNTDARSFLNENKEKFDVITFGTLDSMTRLSALSNVRLDNFVYTRECLAAARAHLTDDGGLIMYFMVGQEFISDHLTALLANTFGQLPKIHRGGYSLFNTVFMAGPAFDDPNARPDPNAWYEQEDLIRQVVSSDDWPYLYLPRHQVTPFYLSMMALLAGIGVLAILLASPEMRTALRTRGEGGPDFEMFLYGFAFLLIETKFVTAMNLLWGATWLTSAVVFGSILAVILAGTVFTELKPIPWQRAGVGLVAALMVIYVLPLHLLLSTSPAIRLALSAFFVGLPVFFASICFASRFKTKPAADVAFGWNLLGAVLGGLAEFFSMATGFKTLTLVALVAYLGAFALGRTRPASPPESASGEAAA